MKMEELLKPRYKVIADYPKSLYNVGDIINAGTTSQDCIYCDNEGPRMRHYPHLFKPLQWWEERKPEDMPEYVRIIKSPMLTKEHLSVGVVVKVYKHFSCSQGNHNIYGCQVFGDDFMSYSTCTPAVKEESEAQHRCQGKNGGCMNSNICQANDKCMWQPLFDHMDQEHGLILLEEKMQQVRPQGAATDDEIKAAWKKRMGINFDEYGAMKDYCFYQQGYDDAASVIRQGAVWVKASKVLPEPMKHIAIKIGNQYYGGFYNDEHNMIYSLLTHHYWPTTDHDLIQGIEWLDESATPTKESDVVEFAEWLLNSRILPMPNYGNWGCFENDTTYSTEQLYELFIKQKEIKP